jgi:hypothetical protein
MSMSANPYYNPELCGLTQVATLNQPDLDYQYNMMIVVMHVATGRLFFAQDSGCSCPTPFEEFRFDGPDDTDMEEITLANFDNFQRAAGEFPVLQDERDEAIDSVKKLLTASKRA